MPNVTQFSERLIKKYPNRRLYDTQTSAYITLPDVKKLVMDNAAFSVLDARTGEDLTRSVLLQIVMEEEEAGKPLLSSAMLSLMIRYYGHAMQDMLASCLETSTQAIALVQDKMATIDEVADDEALSSIDSLLPMPSVSADI